MNDYSEHYSENSFWDKIRRVCKAAGKKAIEQALVLYHCLHDNDTPSWAKAVIIGALGYFIFPLDAIPDVPPVGYVDDISILLGAVATIAGCVKDHHHEKAKEQLKQWFD